MPQRNYLPPELNNSCWMERSNWYDPLTNCSVNTGYKLTEKGNHAAV